MSIPFSQLLMDELSHISFTKLSNVAYIYILVPPIHMAYLHLYIYIYMHRMVI